LHLTPLGSFNDRFPNIKIFSLYPNPSSVNLTTVQFGSLTGIWVELAMKNGHKITTKNKTQTQT
jgi:hypothetical protein